MFGDMTLRGVTKPMEWEVTFNGGLYNSYAQAQAVGFSATGLIRRSDRGMTELIGVVGDAILDRVLRVATLSAPYITPYSGRAPACLPCQF